MPKAVIRPNGYAPKARPIGGMNVTPFIDVLLVLFVMLILAVPIKMNETPIDLPGEPPEVPFAVLDENTVYITDADELLWNGQAVSPAQLRLQVEAASAIEDQPLLRFEPAALASYDRSARTIALIRESGAQRFAFVGNYKYRDLN